MLEKGVDFIRNVAYIGKCAVERDASHPKRTEPRQYNSLTVLKPPSFLDKKSIINHSK
jgi:hypothetical protein